MLGKWYLLWVLGGLYHWSDCVSLGVEDECLNGVDASASGVEGVSPIGVDICHFGACDETLVLLHVCHWELKGSIR